MSEIWQKPIVRKTAHLDNLINETFYFETKRLENSSYNVNFEDDRKWLSRSRKRFRNANEKEKKKLVEEIIERHSKEVAGNFSRWVYQITTKVAPGGLGIILKGFSPLKFISDFPKLPDVSEHIKITGELEYIQKLMKIGTVILTPTHSSNLDSIVVGYSLYKLGLPPFTYGAGLNLFQHKFFGFFMNRLGAYKVDRLKSHSLYKEVLKEYATITLELGYPNLFFPGGTRVRTGALESKIKLGLLGCGIKSYYNNIVREKAQPKIFIVPCTINYELVLEAETLIEDHLMEAGKSRYIIVDDEFSMPDRFYQFVKSLVSLDSKIYVRFGRGFDPFGNDVDDEGNSIDNHGREIDTEKYFYSGGNPVEDNNRDSQYTKELALRIVESYKKNNIVFATNILAFTVFELIYQKSADPDFYRFLRETAYDVSIPMTDVYKYTRRILEKIKNLDDEKKLIIAPELKNFDADDIVHNALKLFSLYHTKPVIERRGDRIFPVDMNLLYYYRNRLWSYGLVID